VEKDDQNMLCEEYTFLNQVI